MPPVATSPSTRSTSRRRRVSGAALASALVLALVSCKGTSPATGSVLAQTDSWCPDGFEVGPQDTCFAIPERHDARTPVLVYLHGMYQGHGSAEEWSLVRQASERGFAVVVPRGKRGLCAWTAELKDHFCWPHEVDDPHAFRSIVAEWERVLWQVEALLEEGTHNRYVLGFSNGGFFAEYLALQGLFPAQAYAIVNGGPLLPPEDASPKAPRAPVLLVSASDDAQQAPKMRELHEGLAKIGWAHAFCPRPGAHPLAREDVDAALRFFRRDVEGTLRPVGGAYPCEAAHR